MARHREEMRAMRWLSDNKTRFSTDKKKVIVITRESEESTAGSTEGSTVGSTKGGEKVICSLIEVKRWPALFPGLEWQIVTDDIKRASANKDHHYIVVIDHMLSGDGHQFVTDIDVCCLPFTDKTTTASSAKVRAKYAKFLGQVHSLTRKYMAHFLDSLQDRQISTHYGRILAFTNDQQDLTNFRFSWQPIEECHKDSPHRSTNARRKGFMSLEIMGVNHRNHVLVNIFQITPAADGIQVDTMFYETPDVIQDALENISSYTHTDAMRFSFGRGLQFQQMLNQLWPDCPDYKALQRHLNGFWKVFSGSTDGSADGSADGGFVLPPFIKKYSKNAFRRSQLYAANPETYVRDDEDLSSIVALRSNRTPDMLEYDEREWDGVTLGLKTVLQSYGLKKQFKLKKVFDVSLMVRTNTEISSIVDHSRRSDKNIFIGESLPCNDRVMEALKCKVFILRSGIFRVYDRLPTKMQVLKHLAEPDCCEICFDANPTISCGTCASLLCPGCSEGCQECPYCREESSQRHSVITDKLSGIGLLKLLK